jgi:hypothetical protein
MFFSRFKLTAMAAVVAISLVAGAVVLAQQDGRAVRELQRRSADTTEVSWTYEILVSRDGRNSRKLATITVIDSNPTRVETPDEVIVIRPKTRSRSAASSKLDVPTRKSMIDDLDDDAAAQNPSEANPEHPTTGTRLPWRADRAATSEQDRNANSALRKSLTDKLERYKNQIDELRAELKALMLKRTVDATKKGDPKPKKNNDDRSPRAPGTLDEQRIRLAQEMIDTQLKIIKVESDLQAAEAAAGIPPDDKHREQQIQDQFRGDPEVLALTDEIQLAAEQRDRARSMSRQKNDPARRLAEQKYKELTAKYDELWKAKYREISNQLQAKNSNAAQAVDALRRVLELLKALKAKQAALLKALEAKEQVVNHDEFDAAFLQHQLDIVMRRAEQVRAQLKRLESDSPQDRDRAPKASN